MNLDRFAHQWLSWMAAAGWQLALLVCLVAVISGVARKLAVPARWRHAMWLLVLLKVFLPPGLATPLSVGYWIAGPLSDRAGWTQLAESMQPFNARSADDVADDALAAEPGALAGSEQLLTWPVLLLIVWAAGCVLFWAIIVGRYLRLIRGLRTASVIDEGAQRVALERIALAMRLRQVPELLSTEAASSPFLFGVLRPRIVLPKDVVADLGEVELRAVLTHELVHWQHRDTWVGWLQAAAQSLFWFHPFLWWANSQLRHERECACDEAVLRQGAVTSQRYGESLVRVLLTASRGRSLTAGSLVGVFERGAKLQNRLENIMSYESIRKESEWVSRLTLAALAILLLPMGPRAQTPLAAQQAAKPANTAYPQVVATTPRLGATDADPNLKEITVTFDRDMGQGMSWTGGPPLFPPVNEGQKARWIDARTCALPVKLAKGTYYRVGINSSSFQNFKSKEGTAAPSSAIYFATTGASDEVQGRVAAPMIVKLEPANGAANVDPATKSLRATFNVPMGGGMSWTGSGPQFPKSPDGAAASWSADGLTCTLPVALEAGHDYQVGLNSLSYINFQSKWGVPLPPVVYKFRTRGAGE